MCVRGDDRLGTVAHEAAPDAIHIESWAPTAPFNGGEAALPRRRGGADPSEITRLVEWQCSKRRPVGGRERNYIVVEARHGDVAVGIVQ